ncbi:MAG: PilZ domain-containing protein [Kofleriaceae bacterium]
MAARVLVDLEVDCETEENYLFASITDISSTGIFIRTNTPEPAGTRLNLRFASVPGHRPGDAVNDQHEQRARKDATFELEGEVAWVNPLRPGQADNLHPGMGVRFLGLDDDDRKRLLRLIRRIAYLPDAT